MSTGNPDRARRSRADVNYTVDPIEDIESAERGVHGQVLAPRDVVGSLDDTLTSGLDTNSSAGDFSSDDADSEWCAPRSVTRKKSAAERDAEANIAVRLNLAYPVEFREMRSALTYVYKAVCSGSTRASVRSAYHKLLFDNWYPPPK